MHSYQDMTLGVSTTNSNENSSASHAYILSRLNNSNSFDELFEFIKKNTFILNFLEKIVPTDKKIAELFFAIKNGNSNADIFSDENCYLYLLYLIKKEDISFLQGMSVYAYLLALMQFTEKQPIRESDNDTKLLRPIMVESLVKDGNFTTEGHYFLSRILERLTQAEHQIDLCDLEKYILDLTPVEQWLIKIPYQYSLNNKKDLHDADRLIYILLVNTPFFNYVVDIFAGGGHCWIPSLTLTHYLLEKISPNPIKMMFQYGSISKNTLRKLHSQDRHPVSISGLKVNSNPNNADGYRCGYFIMFLHDISHTYWGSKLLKNERSFIFNEFIPQLESLLAISKLHQDEAVVQIIYRAIDNAYDFDLTDIRSFNDDDRLIRYLARSFGHGDQSLYYIGDKDDNGQIEFQQIGMPAEDRLYFLLFKMYYELPNNQEKEIWWNILNSIKTGDFYRKSEITTAIRKFAKSAVNQSITPSSYHYYDFDCKPWLHMINNSKNSEDLWNNIFKNNKSDELVEFACNNKIAIFHPYLPITAENMATFKKFVEKIVKTQSKKYNAVSHVRCYQGGLHQHTLFTLQPATSDRNDTRASSHTNNNEEEPSFFQKCTLL